MKVRYIGKRETYQDSINGVGLIWNLGESKEVTSQVAERLALFPDTWEVIRGDVLKKGATGKKAKDEAASGEKPIDLAPEPRKERVLPVINFHEMNKAALIAYTDRYYNEQLNQNKSEAEVRKDAIEVFTRKENQRIDEEEEKDRMEAALAERKKEEELELEKKAKENKAVNK